MQGFTLEDLNFTEEFSPKFQAVKEAVLPFKRFPGSDTLLGPEMRSTGAVSYTHLTLPTSQYV